ncbi:O-antigen ligase family protein [Parasphingorhabdus cellanae]|uniref:O-antigen ligase family protein n=1 Tax=Parasphingorhabdus cellanae TaxID=2806553 RepID=A0ABX7T2R5_9SPHN|nr:O-antigen ligase family protein [Parasphingorhabdus cellanae]QTD54842.1 O-antigen ligase family protein [Parasphingorhabdus cellanae]
MKISKRTLKTFMEKLSAPEIRFYAFMIFFAIVFFTGGGARDDIQSLLMLRPLAVLFCAYALAVKIPGQWRERLFPIYIACSLLALMVFQLIPLPPSIWTGLPGRQIFSDIANIAGIEQPWRPLSLSPSRTLNSLFSLAVPIAAMMLYLNLDNEYRKRAIPVIIILCAVSGLWAVFQMVGPSRGPLYLYRITNFGSGVGLFANRNHQAVVLSCAIVMLGWYAASQKPNAKLAVLKLYASIATMLVFIPLIFVTGSRAGLLLMVPSLLFALFFIYFGRYNSRNARRQNRPRNRKQRFVSPRQVILFVSGSAIIGFAALSVIFSRSLAYDRLFNSGGINELRIQVLPTLITMIRDYMPWGSGFGSFEHVYKIYEPLKLLNPSYFNQAHNDWLQYPIEGGAAAVLIAVLGGCWFLIRLTQLAKNWRFSRHEKYAAIMCISIMLFLLAASIGDYPLRVPSVIALFAVLACIFNDSVRAVQLSEMRQLQ